MRGNVAMGLNSRYIDEFFKLYKSKKRRDSFNYYLKESIDDFLRNENKSNAFDVYVNFFDSYKMVLTGNKNLIDLLDVLRYYEENAAVLVDKQRDHYVHSVNVFLLGLSIYSQNNNFRDTVEEDFNKITEQNRIYDTDIEKFLFEWGIASLCHDVGYPMEITNNQIKKFVDLVSASDDKSSSASPYIGFNSFEALNSIHNSSLIRPLDLLSYNIHNRLGTDLTVTKEKLYSFLSNMQKSGFVDHGFYSAIILLKWYGYLINEYYIDKDDLDHPIVNCAGAILLHNYYKNVLMKDPFCLGSLSCEQHPIAYLLILCDELQEWNREAYGIEDKKKVLADESRIEISKNYLKIDYLAPKGIMESNFAIKKEQLLSNILDLNDVFVDGLNVTCLASTDLFIEDIQRQDANIAPRPLLENLEKIAMAIHEDYLQKQRERNPDAPSLPSWDKLSQSLKYSNIRQARTITDKLKRLRYTTAEASADLYDKTEIKALSDSQVEYLAKIEHDSWMNERIENGWTYSKEKDTDKKISPYIVPYDDLSEEIKELDRDAVRNMIPLLNGIGVRVFEI